MHGRDHSYPGLQLAAWHVTEDRLPHLYFPVNFFEISDNFNPIRGNYCLLSCPVNCAATSQ